MKKIILPVLLFFIAFQGISQDKKDKIKALKVAFITERLELTEKEAQEFWPVYNAYDDITNKIKFEDLRAIRRDIKEHTATLSSNQASDLLNQLVTAENKLHAEEDKLITKLKKIISPKKILMLKVAEEDFKRKMFDQWKKMRRERK
ncbi:hypothetical protein PK35_05540 [Tamlana nanhaiensis]|uniref:Sensor of ECF-type sigma factor n=1 Tax=Neotamlana nanhaiensis TaxID=1382798 RepID=A0A0D7W6A1_9FLAO|nr:hypothetical protein [Tamlana nanhaiensis]KJD33322.1 hypothetical protein PK35_05540 [Tamlana nanhaiensis]